MIALAVSATNGCAYCVNSHTVAVKKLGLDDQGLGELMAVVAMFNSTNSLAEGYQVGPIFCREGAMARAVCQPFCGGERFLPLKPGLLLADVAAHGFIKRRTLLPGVQAPMVAIHIPKESGR